MRCFQLEALHSLGICLVLGSQYGRLRDLLPALRGDFRKFGTTKLKNWERVLGKDLGQAKVGEGRKYCRNSFRQFSVVFLLFSFPKSLTSIRGS